MRVLQQGYNWFDGFVILHGTDTMAYTASALSYMLENLGKTVIVTGSQVRRRPGLGGVRRVQRNSCWPRRAGQGVRFGDAGWTDGRCGRQLWVNHNDKCI